MNEKSRLLLRLAFHLPDGFLPSEQEAKKRPLKAGGLSDEKAEGLVLKLQSLRKDSLAGQHNDVRAQARLTSQTAALLRQLRTAQGLPADAEFEVEHSASGIKA